MKNRLKKLYEKLYEKLCEGGAYAMGTLLLIACVLAPTALVLWLIKAILGLLGVI